MKTIKTIAIIALSISSFGVAQADSVATSVVAPDTASTVTPCGSPNCSAAVIPANGPTPDAASMLTPGAAAADANAIANQNMVLNPPADPGVSFFVALSTCTPGTYQVRNPLADKFGSTWLDQQIQGFDQKNICRVDITTPDGRVMHCGFNNTAIAQVVDQHFLSGMLQAGTNEQSKNYMDSEQIWSDMKMKYCGF